MKFSFFCNGISVVAKKFEQRRLFWEKKLKAILEARKMNFGTSLLRFGVRAELEGLLSEPIYVLSREW